MHSSWIRRLALVFSYAVVFLVLSEVGLRILFPGKAGKLLFEDSRGLPVYKSGLSETRPSGTGKKPIVFRTNRYGARDHRDKFEGNTILMVGDSNVSAAFLDYEQTPTQVLERVLSRNGSAFNVINYGVDGYGPDQSLLRLRRVLDGHEVGKVQYVVFHVFADNDYGDLLRNNILDADTGVSNLPGTVPGLSIYDRTIGGMLVARALRRAIIVAGGPDLEDINRLLVPGYYSPEAYPSDLQETTRAAKRNYLDAWVAQNLFEFEQYKRGGRTNWLYDHYDFALSLGVSEDLKNRVANKIESVLTELADLGAQRYFVPIVVVQPAEIDAADTWMVSANDMAEYAAERGYAYSPGGLSALAADAARGRGLHVVDLFADFSSERGMYFSFEEKGWDNHWSVGGIEIAMERVGALISRIERERDEGCAPDHEGSAPSDPPATGPVKWTAP
jgi:hypothetical protein